MRTDVAGGAREAYARDRPFLREGDVFEVLAHGSGVAQVVMLTDEALVETLPRECA